MTHPSSSDKIEELLVRLTTQQLTLSSKIDDFISHITPLFSPASHMPSSLPRPFPVPAQHHRLKLDVPRFDGTDALGWIFKINQYFKYHGTPEYDRLTIASFYMEGRALAWFQWMTSNGQFTSWPVFLQALQNRFAPSQYEDPTGTLCKLMQKGSVASYLSEFEDLANRVVGIPPAFLLSCFISGLIPEIRREVQAHQPLTLSQAAGLARLQEEKLGDLRPPPSTMRSRPPSLSSSSFSPRPQPLSPLSPSPSAIRPPPPQPSPTQPFKRLTSEEIASRRERGLCFSCDEKYHRGHRCASRVFLFIAEGDAAPDPPHIAPLDPTLEPDPDPTEAHDPHQAQLSLNSMAGHLAPETLRFVASIADVEVVLLVDGGSTHNFIQQQLVEKLGLPSISTTPLRVMVGNGQQLSCSCMCQAVAINIQNNTFIVDLYILPISGANVVLGVQWLKTLGPVLTDYNTLSMQFFSDDRIIKLQGDLDAKLHLLTPVQLRRLNRTQGDALFYHITLLSNSTPSLPQEFPAPIQDLLLRFEALFTTPSTLPPARATDHHIHLIPQATPVNVRPYRYPHYQKQEIEQQVDAMLQKGLIQPSTSPFSSPVLLVKKHDGSWRFCIDYRALNALTIRDRFPIPTIDELLDELGGACYFSKVGFAPRLPSDSYES